MREILMEALQKRFHEKEVTMKNLTAIEGAILQCQELLKSQHENESSNDKSEMDPETSVSV